MYVCACMRVCVCVRAYACLWFCVCVHTHYCVYVCVCVCVCVVCVRVRACVRAWCVYVCARVSVCVRVCVHACVVCVCVYLHTCVSSLWKSLECKLRRSAGSFACIPRKPIFILMKHCDWHMQLMIHCLCVSRYQRDVRQSTYTTT